MDEVRMVYILEAVVPQTGFTDGYGEQALPNFVILDVFENVEDAEREQARCEAAERTIRDETDTDPVRYIIETYVIK